MFFEKLNLISFYSDFFETNYFNYTKNIGRILLNENYWINNCIFLNFSANLNGSCIYLNNLNDNNLVLENNIFSYCNSNGISSYGGCLYYSTFNGNFIMKKNCISNIFCVNIGDFGYVQIGINKNLTCLDNTFLNFSLPLKGSRILYFCKGQQLIVNINITYSISKTPSIHCYSYSNLLIKYLTFSSIKCSHWLGIWFEGYNGNLIYSNFYNLTDIPFTYGIIFNGGNLFYSNSLINYCSFFNNTNKLFENYKGNLFINNSFIQNNIINIGIVQFFNNSNVYYLNNINHFKSFHCNYFYSLCFFYRGFTNNYYLRKNFLKNFIYFLNYIYF